MTYEQARAAHAEGRTVSCGMGLRPAYARWNEWLDLAAERTSTEWRAVSYKAAIENAPGSNPEYRRNARRRYERVS